MKNLKITLEGKTYDIAVEVVGEASSIAAASSVAAAAGSVVSPMPVAAAAGSVVSPMPGVVFKVKVVVGDLVAADQELLILEAMKMESPVYASAAGTVSSVLVKEGDSVSEGQLLVQLS